MMIAEIPGDIEGALGLEDPGEVEKMWYLYKIPQFYCWSPWRGTHFEGSIFGGHGWTGTRRDFTRMISECSICQKIKYQREPN